MLDNENREPQDMSNDQQREELEQKLHRDIEEKIADAAAEVQDEIDDAAQEDSFEEVKFSFDQETDSTYADGEEAAEPDSWSDEAYAEEDEQDLQTPKKISITGGMLTISLIGAAVVGALIMYLCTAIPGWVEARPEGDKVAAVNGTAITDMDVNYQLYAEAMNYFNSNALDGDPYDYDWDKNDEDGNKISDVIREKAINAAIDQVVTLQQGEKNGVAATEDETKQIESAVSGFVSQYGEEGFIDRIKTMGITTVKQYTKMYAQVTQLQKVQEDMETNASNYYPEDVSVLEPYVQSDRGSAKHILIKNDSSSTAQPAEGEEAAPVEDKRAKAQEILDRINAGEDFDTLMNEFNEDTGETEAGYTFGTGEMMPAFEEAAFGLKLNEISGIVETSYGYHIIKRIPGLYELQGYWRDQAKVTINKGKLNKLSVSAVMQSIKEANEKLEAEQAAASASAGSSSGSSSSSSASSSGSSSSGSASSGN